MSLVHFITPLAAKDSVKSWPLTCELLRQTLASLENQSVGNFTSTICCHDIPEFANDLDSRFRFVPCPTPPPQSAQTITGANSGVADMMAKRDAALFYIQPKFDEFVAVLDADDLFSRHLVRHLEESSEADGVTFNVGYEFCEMSKRLLLRRDMVGRTSSSFALRGRLLSAPASLDRADMSKTLFHTVWHSNVEEFLQAQGLRHRRLADPIVVYRTNTGLNMSDYYRVNLLRRVRHNLKFLLGRKVAPADWENFRLEK